jgi:hypothetical protein
MGGEHQRRRFAPRRGDLLQGGPNAIADGLDEQWMRVPIPDVVDLRRSGAHLLARNRHLAFVAARARLALMRCHDESDRPPPPLTHHALQRLVQVRCPAAQSDVGRQRQAIRTELCFQRLRLTECQLVEGGLPTDELIMMHQPRRAPAAPVGRAERCPGTAGLRSWLLAHRNRSAVRNRGRL